MVIFMLKLRDAGVYDVTKVNTNRRAWATCGGGKPASDARRVGRGVTFLRPFGRACLALRARLVLSSARLKNAKK